MNTYKNLFKIDKTRITIRFAQIEKRLNRLRKLLKEESEVDFLVDEDTADLAAHNLQIAIQACLDIADHLISVFGLELPKEDKKEVFPILGKNKIISDGLSPKLKDMAGMRNVLVHEYTEVQRQEVYKAIKNNLGDIEEFVSQIQKFMDKLAKN